MASLDFADPATLNCTVQTCQVETSFYNYRISLAANLTLLALFAALCAVYKAIWLFTRRAHFFNAAMTLGLIVEMLGYAARVWSYYDQWDENAYLMQIICLTLAPAFFSAGIYVCLGHIVTIYGVESSRLKPLWYTYIFIPCDAVALLLQAVGGGMSASALAQEDLSTFYTGNNILTAGLAWQVFTLFSFLALCADFAVRVRRRSHRLGDTRALSQATSSRLARQSKLLPYFLVAVGLATVLIFWRCVYRLVELNSGFTGPITFDQGLFIGFEGVLIVVAATALAVTHPAICLGDAMGKRPRTNRNAQGADL